ncbi:MAG: type 4a pilus biogenesis protein PilO [Candidatus Omnitrophica bacterium]|nr:type 4a pilus biogenesis protein PilO [Candidatus Omnitrophota bacterium]
MNIDFLIKAKKNEIMTFGIIVGCVLFVVYYLVFLSPVISRFLTMHRDVSRAQSELESANLSISRTPQIKKEIEGLLAKRDLYGNKLPKEEEFPLVLENLSNMAKSAGVKITKILPAKDYLSDSDSAESSSIYKQREISITAQCGYHQLGKFIAAMEGAERFMAVSGISIEASKISPKRHNVELVVSTFILKGDD